MSEVALKGFSPTPQAVARHSFFPLIGYSRVSRRIDFDVFPPVPVKKERPIRYAAHKDAAIYSLYSSMLEPFYETLLTNSSLERSVLAYRSDIGYNVSFAGGLFKEISARDESHVACLDISKFFDSLDHKLLQAALKSALDVSRLTDDWFRVLKSVTQYSFVDRSDLDSVLGRARGRRLCSIEEFRSTIRPLIRSNEAEAGVAQGTPISGMLANVYMLPVDRKLHELTREMGGSYRRYSDDIALCLPDARALVRIIEELERELNTVGLKVNVGKTCISRFCRGSDGQLVGCGDQLQYLGLTFDGSHARIRSESIAAFYSRMKRSVRRSVKSAAEKGILPQDIRRRVLVGRFTHWGDNRNFVQYAYRASQELKSDAIRRQLARHVRIFDAYWLKMIKQYY